MAAAKTKESVKARSVLESHFEDNSRQRAQSQVLIGDLEAVVDVQLLQKAKNDAEKAPQHHDVVSSNFGSSTGEESQGRVRSKSTHSSKAEIMEQKMAKMADKIGGHLKKKFKNLRAKINNKEDH